MKITKLMKQKQKMEHYEIIHNVRNLVGTTRYKINGYKKFIC